MDKRKCAVKECDLKGDPCELPFSKIETLEDLSWALFRWGTLKEGLRIILHQLRYGYVEMLEYFCAEHAVENGYCCGCGNFWAGVEAFDFSLIRGICPNCISEYE